MTTLGLGLGITHRREQTDATPNQYYHVWNNYFPAWVNFFHAWGV